MPWSSANDASAVLRLGGADEADRAADDRGRARAAVERASRAGGRARSARCRSRPRRRRGSGSHSETAAAVRVVPHVRGQAGHPLVGEEAVHVVAGGQPAGGDAHGHHPGVAEDRRAGVSAARAGGHQVGVDDQVVDQVDLAAAVDHPDGELLGVGRHAAQVGLARGSSRTSRRRSPARRRRSRSAAAAGCERASSAGTSTPRQGVTTRLGVERRRERRGRATPSRRRDVLAAGHGAVRQRAVRQRGAAGPAAHRVAQRRRRARRRATARPARRRARRGTRRASATSAAAPRRAGPPRPSASPTRSCAVRVVERHQPEVGSAGRAGRRGRRRARRGTGRAARPAAGPRTAARRARPRPAAGRRGRRRSPVCGETITLRTSSWLRDGSSPVASIASTTLGGVIVAERRAAGGWPARSGARRRRRTPRRPRPARPARPAGSRPPTSRSRTRAPSSAGQGRKHAGAQVGSGAGRWLDTGSSAVRGSCAAPAGSSRRCRKGQQVFGLGIDRRGTPSQAPDAGAQWPACPARHPYRCASVPDSHRVP